MDLLNIDDSFAFWSFGNLANSKLRIDDTFALLKVIRCARAAMQASATPLRRITTRKIESHGGTVRKG